MKKRVMDNMLFHGSEHADLPYIKANLGMDDAKEEMIRMEELNQARKELKKEQI